MSVNFKVGSGRMSGLTVFKTSEEISKGFQIAEELFRRARDGKAVLLSFGVNMSESGVAKVWIEAHESEVRRAAAIVYGDKKPSEEGKQ